MSGKLDMIRDFMIWISEGLFYLLDGALLISTIWVGTWLVVWVLFMVLPVVYTLMRVYQPNFPLVLLPYALCTFFFGTTMLLGLPTVQQQMLEECGIIDVETVDSGTISLKQCRYKENYYEDFGEWELANQ